jgi:hypothetical protein
VVDVVEPALGGRRHRYRAMEFGLFDVVGDEGKERVVAVLLELTLDQVRAAAPLGGNVGDADAFWWGRGVVAC